LNTVSGYMLRMIQQRSGNYIKKVCWNKGNGSDCVPKPLTTSFPKAGFCTTLEL
jgi:hypothetical protein